MEEIMEVNEYRKLVLLESGTRQLVELANTLRVEVDHMWDRPYYKGSALPDTNVARVLEELDVLIATLILGTEGSPC